MQMELRNQNKNFLYPYNLQMSTHLTIKSNHLLKECDIKQDKVIASIRLF